METRLQEKFIGLFDLNLRSNSEDVVFKGINFAKSQDHFTPLLIGR